MNIITALNIGLGCLLGVATIVTGLASTQMFSTTSRIDALYKDAGEIKADLREVKVRLANVEKQNNKILENVKSMDEKITGSIERSSAFAALVSGSVGLKVESPFDLGAVKSKYEEFWKLQKEPLYIYTPEAEMIDFLKGVKPFRESIDKD